jgi:hypothetical protein
MNNWHLLYWVATQRHREDISKAERYRMAHNWQDGNHQPVRVKWYDCLLGRVGGAMVKLGLHLQARYQAVDSKRLRSELTLIDLRSGCTNEGPTGR